MDSLSQQFLSQIQQQTTLNNVAQQIFQAYPNDPGQATQAYANYLVNNGYSTLVSGYNPEASGYDQSEIIVIAGSYIDNHYDTSSFVNVSYQPGNQPYSYYDPAAPAYVQAMAFQGDVTTDKGNMYLELPWKYHSIFEWATAHGNTLNIAANVRTAASSSFSGSDFIAAVRTGGIFDFKSSSLFDGFADRNLLQEFGNWHFGVVSEAYGLTLAQAAEGAGFYQAWSGYSTLSQYLAAFANGAWSTLVVSMPGVQTNEGLTDFAIRNLGIRFGDNPGDTLAIADGYRSLTDANDRSRLGSADTGGYTPPPPSGGGSGGGGSGGGGGGYTQEP